MTIFVSLSIARMFNSSWSSEICCLEYKVPERPRIPKSEELRPRSRLWLVGSCAKEVILLFLPMATACNLGGNVLDPIGSAGVKVLLSKEFHQL